MSSEIDVQLEFTPNPDTLKYSVNRTLLAKGAKNFVTKEAAQKESPLASNLFSISKVSAVMLGTNFVTVTIRDQDDMMNLNGQVIATIKDFLATGQAVVIAGAETTPQALTEIEKQIVDILDREVRPAVAMDGGDISFEKFEEGFVYLKMQGSCAGCPSSLMTLKMGVEKRLKEAIPEIQEVIPV